MSLASIEALLRAEFDRCEEKVITEGLPGITILTVSGPASGHEVTVTMESEHIGYFRLTIKPVGDSVREVNALRSKGWTHPNDYDHFGDAGRPKFRWSKLWSLSEGGAEECASEITSLLRMAYKVTPEMIFKIQML